MSAHLNATLTRHRAALVLAGLLVVGLSACSDSGQAGTADAGATSTTSAPEESSSSAPAASPPAESSPSSSESPAEEFVITIQDFAYMVPESVPAGATVTVVNEDSQAHTVTAKDKFDVNVGPNATAEFIAPETMGRYDFTCLFHGNMSDTLVTS